MHPKTIDYHHLDMSREDGMDRHGIDWIYGCHQVRFWIKSWANHGWFVSRPHHKSDSARPTWARWPPQNHWLSPSGHVKRRRYGWAWNWLDLWMSSGRILAQKLGKPRLICVTPPSQIWLSTTHMEGQMTIQKPLIITIKTCQDKMVWMGMELIGSMDVIR
jgi:hypothetical protein